MSRSRRRTGPPPSHLRLVVSADNLTDDDATSGGLPAGCAEVVVKALMENLRATAHGVTDRAVHAMRNEVTAYGLDFDAETLAAIRKATFITVATGIYARIQRGFHGSDHPPDEDGVAGDPDDDLHPYVEHSGTGLRERLRAALEADGENS